MTVHTQDGSPHTDGVRHVDVRGTTRAGALMTTIEAMSTLEPGRCLEITTDDPGAVLEIPRWATESGHTCESITTEGRHSCIVLRRGVRRAQAG